MGVEKKSISCGYSPPHSSASYSLGWKQGTFNNKRTLCHHHHTKAPDIKDVTCQCSTTVFNHGLHQTKAWNYSLMPTKLRYEKAKTKQVSGNLANYQFNFWHLLLTNILTRNISSSMGSTEGFHIQDSQVVDREASSVLSWEHREQLSGQKARNHLQNYHTLSMPGAI